MPLIRVMLPPGLYRNGTAYQARGRWWDANLVRWKDQCLQPVGGWTPLLASVIDGATQSPAVSVTVTGLPRGIVGWQRTGGKPYLGIGTISNLYAYSEGALTTITAKGFTTGSADASSSAGGSGLYGKGFYGSGPYGTASALLGHTVDPDVWQLDTFGDYLVGVMAPTDGKLYVWDPGSGLPAVTAGDHATGTLTTTGTFSNGETVTIGGKTYTLQSSLTNVDGNVKIGASTAATLTNLYHAVNNSGGTRGTDYATAMTANSSAWGTAVSSTTLTLQAIAAGTSGNSVATTETCANASFGGTAMSGGTAAAPTGNAAVVVTPERFLVCLGAGGNPTLVQWASQETTTVWTPTAYNTAGSFPLTTAGKLMAGRRGTNETLLWTDLDLYRMTYIGGTLVYGFTRAGSACGLIGPNAIGSAESFHAWMGSRGFFVYNGYVQDLPCEVLDGVFGDFNFAQRAKVSCVPNVDFGELWWFYPSANSSEVDSYVVWNYRDNWWTLGKLARSCGAPKGSAFRYPLMCDTSGNVWQHEVGFTRSGGSTPYADSGPLELDDGERILYANYLYPDDKTQGDVTATFTSSFYPDSATTVTGPFSLASPTSIRFTGRQVRLKVTEANPVAWRVGTVRLDITPGGER